MKLKRIQYQNNVLKCIFKLSMFKMHFLLRFINEWFLKPLIKIRTKRNSLTKETHRIFIV